MGRMTILVLQCIAFSFILPLANPETIPSNVLSFGLDLDHFLNAGVLDVVSTQCREDFTRFLLSSESKFWAAKSTYFFH